MCASTYISRNYSVNLVSYSAGTLLSTNITNLTAGTKYTIVCYARNVVGFGEESDEAVFMTSKYSSICKYTYMYIWIMLV